jgi:thioester reductase-like protein
MLSQVVRLPSVKKVYCLVRASSEEKAQERVLSTLESKGLPQLSAAEIAKIVYLPSDLSKASLGLNDEVLAELRTSLTVVIHSAWAVNFNLGVRSFESHHIKGAYNLLNMCLGTKTAEPARLFFCSSISAAAGTPLPARITETYISDPSHAQSMGYARSKFVTEHIVKAAGEKTGMTAEVLRLGQIIGDTEKGIWNLTEAIPLMMRSAQVFHALPALDEVSLDSQFFQIQLGMLLIRT